MSGSTTFASLSRNSATATSFDGRSRFLTARNCLARVVECILEASSQSNIRRRSSHGRCNRISSSRRSSGLGSVRFTRRSHGRVAGGNHCRWSRRRGGNTSTTVRTAPTSTLLLLGIKQTLPQGIILPNPAFHITEQCHCQIIHYHIPMQNHHL